MSIFDLLPDEDPSGGFAQAVEGVVVKAPASRTDLLHVRIPSFDDEQGFGPLRWQRDGDNLPGVGDSCLVQFTANGGAWVSAWWSDT